MSDGWDQALREAFECGEVIVVRGAVDAGDFALDVVPLDQDSAERSGQTLHADAVARAWSDP